MPLRQKHLRLRLGIHVLFFYYIKIEKEKEWEEELNKTERDHVNIYGSTWPLSDEIPPSYDTSL